MSQLCDVLREGFPPLHSLPLWTRRFSILDSVERSETHPRSTHWEGKEPQAARTQGRKKRRNEKKHEQKAQTFNHYQFHMGTDCQDENKMQRMVSLWEKEEEGNL